MAVHSTKISGVIVSGNLIANEIPLGDINGVNTEFELVNNPVESSVQVILNGMTQQPGSGNDYHITGKIISFLKVPKNGSSILVHYIKI